MPSPVTDPDLLAQLNGGERKPVTDPALLAQLGGKGPEGFAANALDFVKSMPHGLMRGLSGTLSAAGTAEAAAMSDPDLQASIPDQGQTQAALEKNVTGETHVPEGRAGRFGAAIAEPFGSPATFIGPGGIPLKMAGAILSGAGGEAGHQAAEGTAYEHPAALAGALLGGAAAGRVAGPKAPQAATPTLQELKDTARSGYRAAGESGLELHPSGLAEFAAAARRDLQDGAERRFTGGQFGTAPETFKVLDALESAPGGARVTAGNLDALRTYIGDIAGRVQPAQGGKFVPTADAAAASALKGHFNQYLENIPENHVVAGDAQAYTGATREANANYGAAKRLENVDARLTKAENASDRQIAGSLDAQIKSKVGGILDNPGNMRGLTQAEKDQLQLINSGTATSNLLRQAGRGGAGVIPIMGHIGLAAGSGGASIPYQAALAATLYGARKGSEAITKSRANTLADMLAQRSPLYESRVKALPREDTVSNKAALARALFQAR